MMARRARGYVCYPTLAFANHSCLPCVARFDALNSDAASLPPLPPSACIGALAEAGCVNRGDKLNRAYVGDALTWGDVRPGLQSAIVDPQTSGGLLFALPEEGAEQLVAKGGGVIIGRVEASASPGVHVAG